MSHTIAAVAISRTTTWRGDRGAMVEFVDLVALRPIRRKDGTKAVRMADGTLLEIVPVKFLSGQRPDGTWMGEGHPSYLWRMGFVIALLNAGYKVISAENHVLAVTKLPADVVPLSKRRLLSEALNARIAMGEVKVGRGFSGSATRS